MQKTNPVQSTLCILSAMFLLGVADNLIVLISESSSLWLFLAARSAIVVPVMVGLSLLGFGVLWAHRPGWVLLRNFFNATALMIYFGSLAFLPIGVVVAGLFTAPIFVLIFSVLFRGQTVGVWRWAAVGIGFGGALLVVWPSDGALTWLSVLPILAGVFYAISAIGTRAWCEGESLLIMTLSYFAIIGVYGVIGLLILTYGPMGAPAGPDGWLLRGYVAPDPTMIWVTLVQAVASLAGVALLTLGYQLGEASYVAIVEYSLIVFASFFAWILWEQTLGGAALIGIALIILSGAIIALRSR